MEGLKSVGNMSSTTQYLLTGRFISSQDSLARSDDRLSNLLQLLLHLGGRVLEVGRHGACNNNVQ